VETHYGKLQTQEIRGGLSGVGCNAIFTDCCWSAMLREGIDIKEKKYGHTEREERPEGSDR
jgi:hypothetical protein